MDDPSRLIDDPTASPLMRSLLATAGADEPSAGDRGRVVKRLGAAGIVVAAAGKSVSAALIIGLIVAATTIGVVVVKLVNTPATDTSSGSTVAHIEAPSRPLASERAPAIAAPPSPHDRAIADAPVVAAPRPTPAAPRPAPAAPPRVATAPAPSSPTRVAAPLPAPPPAEAPAAIDPPAPDERDEVALAPQAKTDTNEHAATDPEAPSQKAIDARRLAAEVALLDRARAALRNNDITGALAALDEHTKSFADGALAPEADVIRIDALVAAGHRDDARALAAQFLTRYPKSPLARRVRAMFGFAEPRGSESTMFP